MQISLSFSGFVSLFSGLGGGALPILAGVLADRGEVFAVFYFTAATEAIAGFFWIFILIRARNQKKLSEKNLSNAATSVHKEK